MKKDSPHLYEILRKATPPSGESVAPPTLQDRLAAYKAARASSAVLDPAPDPPAAPVASSGPGDRVLRMRVNTALFAGLVGLGLLFLAYVIGARAGRSQAMAEIPTRPSAPASPPKVYTIRLGELPVSTARERYQADEFFHQVKTALGRAGLTGVGKIELPSGDRSHLLVHVGRFQEIESEASRSRLQEVRKVTLKGQPALSGATFAELPAHVPGDGP